MDLINQIQNTIDSKTKPVGSLGTIEEIANAVKYFINTEYTSGHALKINGGLD